MHLGVARWAAPTVAKMKSLASRTQASGFVLPLILAVVGFIAGAAIFVGPFPAIPVKNIVYPVLTPSEYPYLNRRLMIWLFIVCAQMGLWFVVGFTGYLKASRSIKAASWSVRMELVGAAVSIALLLLLPRVVSQTFIGTIPTFDAYLNPRVFLVSILGFLAALPSVVGIWLIHGEAAAIPRPGPRRGNEITRLVELRDELQKHLAILGAIVAAAVVSDNGLRAFQNAALSELLARCDAVSKIRCASADTTTFALTLPAMPPTNIKPDDLRLIPPESTIVYGLFFTLLLVLTYVPVYQRLRAAAQRIISIYSPLPDPVDQTWAPMYQRRKGLEEYIGLQAGPFDNVRASIAVLAPFVGGILGVALPGAH